ncbi:MAG: hypothetical protein V4857_08800 [Pseudomonadota bacterium]
MQRSFNRYSSHSQLEAIKWPRVFDGLTRIDYSRDKITPDYISSSLAGASVQGAIVINETTHEQDAFLSNFCSSLEGRIFPVIRIDPFEENALRLQQKALSSGGFGIYLSSMGSFQSPMQRIALDSIESAPLWRVASAFEQVIIVEPSVKDAHLLPILATAFPRVRILVRGGLFSRLTTRDSPRTLPTPDRFTFDRLHQLENVWVQLSPSHARRIATVPPGTPGGWHSPANLLTLFSNERLVWSSEHLFSPEKVYSGPEDPEDEIPDLNALDRVAIIGGSARKLLKWT